MRRAVCGKMLLGSWGRLQSCRENGTEGRLAAKRGRGKPTGEGAFHGTGRWGASHWFLAVLGSGGKRAASRCCSESFPRAEKLAWLELFAQSIRLLRRIHAALQ